MSTQKSLFANLLEDAKATVEGLKTKNTAKRVKRKFSSMYDDAEDQVDSQKDAITAEYAKLENMDLNVVLAAKQTIRALKDQQAGLKDAHRELFGEDLKID